MTTRSVIGKSLRRAEGASKVTGAATYTADVVLPDALWAGFVRSPYPHARILRIDASRALALPGVKVVVTGQDLPKTLVGVYSLKDKYPIAVNVVRYVGERVAGVAAVDQDTLEEALGLVEVEYEQLPAVFDPLEALKPEAPVLHPDYFSYRSAFDGEDVQDSNMETQTNTTSESVLPFMPGTVYGPRNLDSSVKNIQTIWRLNKGDIDAGFAEADRVFEGTYTTPIISQAYLEPGGVVVDIDGDGVVHIWTSSQLTFQVRRSLSQFADLPEEGIMVHPVNLGGSFGGKMLAEQSLCGYYIAKAAGQPIRIIEKFQEVLIDGAPRHASIVQLRAGVKNDGRLCAWDAKIYFNGGAYTGRTPLNGNMNGTLRLAGSYRTPNVRIESDVVYTNLVPGGYYRSPGGVQALFAVESLIDEIATSMGIDRLEFRLMNAVRPGDTLATDQALEDPRAVEVLEELRRLTDWKDSKPSEPGASNLAIGRGLACGHRHIGGGECHMRMRLEPDGTLLLMSGVADTGTGAHTMHRQIVAEILEVDPDLIRVRVTGTDGPYDEGVRASRGAHVEGQAAAATANNFMVASVHQAAEHWGVPEGRVQWRSGSLMNLETETLMNLADLAGSSSDGPVEAEGRYRGGIGDVYDFQGMVADVAVDTETGQVHVQQLYYTHDVTKIINPILHDGQLHGAIIQGIGHTLMEDVVTDEGTVVTQHLGDYKIPNVLDIPSLTMTHVEAAVGPGPFNIKGVSELGIGMVAPAIANAIFNATGVRVKSLPLLGERVLVGLREKGGS
ncbi:MAG: carbon-monoxide dehydrogenase large subunit [Chloroflexi bacterium]|nr:MAG: carbon-monoxide dehydrogenase large subunit [Chloroflexota bacterium]